MKIGMIGLGIMGKPMTINLINAGFNVTVFDVNEEAIKEVVSLGATKADTPKSVAIASDFIITMLPNAAIVKEVLFGENGIIEGAQPGTVVIDMSSVSPVDSTTFSTKLGAFDVKLLDAPVSGGEPKAIDGTLSIMVGGDETAFQQALPIFQAMGKDIIHVGPSGSGSTTKLANQILVNVTIAALSEAVTLAAKSGVNLENMYQAIRGGLAGSTVLDAKMPLILERNFEPGGRIDINMKDLTNVLNAGREVGVPLPLTSNVLEMFHALKTDGKAGDDHIGLIQYYEKLANFKVTGGEHHLD